MIFSQSKLNITSLLICFTVIFSSCDVIHEKGNGVIVSEQRNISSFNKLRIEGTYQVILQQSTDSDLIIKTDENLIPHIETYNEDEYLIVRNSSKIYSEKGIKVIIRFQEIEEIISGGASLLFTEGILETENLFLSMNGIGLIEFALDVEKLDVALSGAGRIRLNGKATRQEINLSGAGNYEAFDLESEDCEIKISGLGGAKLNVSNNLDASVSGVGGIEYIGDPKVKRSTSGIGDVKKVMKRSS